MNELIRILYDYAYRRHMLFYLENDVQYHECEIVTDRQYDDLQKLLDEDGRQRLEDYANDLRLQHDLELEAMFRAGLSLGQTLSRL